MGRFTMLLLAATICAALSLGVVTLRAEGDQVTFGFDELKAHQVLDDMRDVARDMGEAVQSEMPE
jgi:hypothetical protein